MKDIDFHNDASKCNVGKMLIDYVPPDALHRISSNVAFTFTYSVPDVDLNLFSFVVENVTEHIRIQNAFIRMKTQRGFVFPSIGIVDTNIFKVKRLRLNHKIISPSQMNYLIRIIVSYNGRQIGVSTTPFYIWNNIMEKRRILEKIGYTPFEIYQKTTKRKRRCVIDPRMEYKTFKNVDAFIVILERKSNELNLFHYRNDIEVCFQRIIAKVTVIAENIFYVPYTPWESCKGERGEAELIINNDIVFQFQWLEFG